MYAEFRGSQCLSHAKAGQLYGAFSAALFVVYHMFDDVGLSTFLALSVWIQILALALLRLHVHYTQSVAGLSRKTIVCQAMVHAFRLCSTLWLRGYIPIDSTGDWLYQASDIAALCLALSVIRCFFTTGIKHTYAADADELPLRYVLPTLAVLAALVHPDLNDRPVFDAIWTFSLYVDVVCMLPQLFMMQRLSKNAQHDLDAYLAKGGVSGHYVAATAFSRFISLVFWYHGFVELAPDDGSFNMSGWTIMTATVVQALLLADFVFVYARTMLLRARQCLGRAGVSL